MKILVTGASGFIGFNITKKLVEEGHEVTAIGSRSENKVPEVAMFMSTHMKGINWERVPAVDAVIHQAANNDTLCKDEDEMLEANVEDTKLLFEKMYEKGCKRFICASSTAIYGNEPAPYYEDGSKAEPLNLYGQTKLLMEWGGCHYAEQWKDLIFIPLRYCNVYGPGEEHKGHRASMIYQLAKQMTAMKRPKLFKDGEQRRDWIYIDDVVKANLLALEHPKSTAFNCGYGEACTFNQLVQWINDILMPEPYGFVPEYIDNPNEDTYQTFTECNMDKAKRELGFVPQISPQEGIEKYLKYLLAV